MTADRIADLERLAYGSGASDDEREGAVRELLELRASATQENAIDAGATEATEATIEPSGIEAAGADGPDVDVPVAATAADPRRRVRRVIIAATAALIVGVLAGWQLGAREAEQQAELAAAADSVFPGPRTQAEYLAALPVAADSPAIEVFDRLATDADTPAVPWAHDFGEGAAEFRLLATRGDGTSVYAAHDGDEYCLFIVLAELDAGSMGCTEEGRFPAEGLEIGLSVSGSPSPTFSVKAVWRPDGSIVVLVPGAALTAPTG